MASRAQQPSLSPRPDISTPPRPDLKCANHTSELFTFVHFLVLVFPADAFNRKKYTRRIRLASMWKRHTTEIHSTQQQSPWLESLFTF